MALEILNDWDAVVAFVKKPEFPPTNNDSERVLRHAVIGCRVHGSSPPLQPVYADMFNCTYPEIKIKKSAHCWPPFLHYLS